MAVSGDGDDALPTGGWKKAPAGKVVQIGRQLRRRRRRRVFLRAAAAAAAAVLTGGAAGLVWLGCRDEGPDFGGIPCAEVQRLAPAYLRGEVEEPVRGRIAAHLARCPRCGPLVRQMQQAGRA